MGRKPKQGTETKTTKTTKTKRKRKTKAESKPVENIKLDDTSEKEVPVKIKKKRGRKPKVKTDNDNTGVPKIPKKRGRKPKGGKIIKNITSNHVEYDIKPNVILHLKCSLSDIEPKQMLSNLDYDPNVNTTIEPYNNDTMNLHIINEMNLKTSENEFNSSESNSVKLKLETINKEEKNTILSKNRSRSNSTVSTKEEQIHIKDIWKKLKELEKNLHTNNISDKKSACFWCTCDFDNPPIYIPKHFLKGSYHVYGCFCSPECATAHLMKENISSSAKFERYHLLNHIYCKIYDYKKNINPAPNPYYILNKYYGNLSIQEYRKLLKNERLLLIVDKPLTRILPELHQDNDDFLINSNSIPASKYNVMKKRKKESKASILSKNFGM